MTRTTFVLCLCALAVMCGCGSRSGLSDARRGMAAFREGRYAKAIDCLEAAARRITNSPELYYHLGLAHLERGNLGPAQAAFQAALDLGPAESEANALGGLGLVAYHQQDFAGAAAVLERALEAAADDGARARILSMMGVVEVFRENPNLAHVNYLRALKADRRYAPAQYNLSVLYLEQHGLLEESLDGFEMFVRNPQVDKKSAYRDKAEGHIKLLRMKLEREKAGRVNARRDPARAAGLLQEGVNAYAARQYPKAVRAYKDALAADPYTFNAAYGLGMACRQQGLRDEAFEAFRRATDIKPENQDCYHQAAELALQARQPAEAVRILTRALARSPFNAESAKLMARAAYADTRIAEARAYGEFYLALATEKDPGRAPFEKWVRALPKQK